MPAIRVKRGTRAQINSAASAGQLSAGEPYLITDESRLAVGTSPTAFTDFAKLSETGGGGGGGITMGKAIAAAIVFG